MKAIAVTALLLVQGSYFIGTDGRRYWSPLDVPDAQCSPPGLVDSAGGRICSNRGEWKPMPHPQRAVIDIPLRTQH